MVITILVLDLLPRDNRWIQIFILKSTNSVNWLTSITLTSLNERSLTCIFQWFPMNYRLREKPCFSMSMRRRPAASNNMVVVFLRCSRNPLLFRVVVVAVAERSLWITKGLQGQKLIGCLKVAVGMCVLVHNKHEHTSSPLYALQNGTWLFPRRVGGKNILVQWVV